MITRCIAISTAVVTLCFLVGCSKSSTSQASSESSSNSSSSPFKSSSKSSSGSDEADEAEEAYQRDVRDYTATLAASELDVQSYQRDLSAFAEAYGISDWERSDVTFVAIGRGLAKAQIGDRRFRELAVDLANRNYAHLALLKSGYETYRAQ